jgi:hypothetical protein
MKRFNTTAVTFVLALLTVPLFSARSSAQQDWDPDRYIELVEEANEHNRQAEVLPEGADAERRELLIDSARAMQAAFEMLRAALNAGVFDEYDDDVIEAAKMDLGRGYQALIDRLIELEFCDAAQLKLDEALNQTSLLSPTLVAELEAQQPRVEVCGVTPEPVAEPVVLVEEPQPTEEGLDPVPIILVGTGAALLAGALITDLVLAGDRDEFDTIQTECDNTGTCNEARLVELGENLDTGRIVVATLLGAGIVVTTVGIIMFFTRDDEESSESFSVTPTFSRDGVGFGVFGEF